MIEFVQDLLRKARRLSIQISVPTTGEGPQAEQHRIKTMAFAETLPAKVNVDKVLGTLQTRGAFTTVALDLYDECRLLVDAVARQHEPDRITSRERAIGCGLLVRISKFMFATAALVRDMGRCGEIVKALNRCQMESAINLLVLLKRNSPEAYAEFVAAGLGPEKEFYDVIHANIAARGGIRSPWKTGCYGRSSVSSPNPEWQ